MKILMCGSPNEGVGLWRMTQARKVLENLGHEVELYEVSRESYEGPQKYLEDIAELIGYFAPDTLWCGRIDRTTVALFRKCREMGVKWRVFDTDDLFHDIPETNPAHKAMKSKVGGAKKLFDAVAGSCDAMTVTTPFLQQYYDNWRGAPTFLCPNAIDPSTCKPLYVSPDNRLRVGMVYNTNRHGDYLPYLPMLKDLVEAGTIHLTLFSGFPEDFYGLDPSAVRWVRHTPPEMYWTHLGSAGLDVVFNPMAPHDFNLAKSNIKWQEATAIGAVCLTTKWGEMDVPGVDWALPADAPVEAYARALTDLATAKDEGTLSGEVEKAHEALVEGWTVDSERVQSLYAKVIEHVEHCDWSGGVDGSDVDNDLSGDERGSS